MADILGLLDAAGAVAPAPKSEGAGGKSGAAGTGILAMLDAAGIVDPQAPVTTGSAVGRAFVNRVGQNVLNIPAAAAGALTPTEFPETPAQARVRQPTTGQELIRQTGERMGLPSIPNPIDLVARVAPNPVELLGQGFSALAEGVKAITPDISSVRALPGLVTGGVEGFQEAREAALTEDIRQAQEAPVGTAVGTIAGDAATLLAARTPLVRGRARAERGAPAVGRVANAAERGAQLLRRQQAVSQQVARRLEEIQRGGGFRATLSSAAESKLAKLLGRGVGRAAEAGVESAALAALQDGDPLVAAGTATAAQVAQSVVISATIPKSAKDAIWKGVLLFGAMTMLGPGQVDLIAAGQDSFQKFFLGLGAGGLALLAGGGRTSSRNQAALVDAISSLPRGAFQSALREWRDVDPDTFAVMQRFALDPEYRNSLTTTQQRLMARALGNPDRAKATVERLGLR